MNARLGLGLLAFAAYALACHLLMLHAAEQPWAIAALLGPFLLPLLAYGWRRRSVALISLGAAAAAGLVAVVAAGGLGDVRRLYLLQHLGAHAVLGAVFAASLRAPGTPMITQFAARVHPVLSPGMVAYTLRLTQVWVGYFAAMSALSLAVYLVLPWSAWSLLANVITPLAIGVLLVGEHGVRYRLHPEFERVSFADTLRSFSQRQASHG